MYVDPNFKTKAALKRAVQAGEQVRIFQPGPWGGNEPANVERQAVEGPYYPEPHRWYALVQVEDGLVTKVVS